MNAAVRNTTVYTDAFAYLPGDHPIQNFIPGANVTSMGEIVRPDQYLQIVALFLVIWLYYGCGRDIFLDCPSSWNFWKKDVSVPAPRSRQDLRRLLLPRAMFPAPPPALVTDHLGMDVDRESVYYNRWATEIDNEEENGALGDNKPQKKIIIVPPKSQQQQSTSTAETRPNSSSFKQSCHRFCNIIVCCIDCIPPLFVNTHTVPAALMTAIANREADEEAFKNIPARY